MAVASHLKSMDFSVFIRASEGLTHLRGIIVSFLAMVLGGAFLFLGMYAVANSSSAISRMMLLVCWMIYLAVVGTGVSATGIMLLDRARHAPARSVTDALVFGFICFLKACVVGIALGVAALAVMVVAAIFYFICKIPGIGPILLFFTHLVLVLLAGLFAFLTSIFAALTAPALWDGDSVTQAIAKSIAILKERAVIAVLYLLVMGIVAATILGIIGAVVVPGYFSMTALATGIIGPRLGGNPAMLTDSPMAMMTLSSGAQSGHVMAVMLSTAVLAMLCLATALQVQLMGINLVYLGVSAGIDSAGAEHLLRQQLDQAKAKADEAKQRALSAAERAKQVAQQARTAAPPSTDNFLCPGCNAAIMPADHFCENCGQKLK